MLSALFQNLRGLHRHTALVEMMDWDEEKAEEFLNRVSKVMDNLDKPEELVPLCMKQAEGLINEDQMDNLKLLLEEEVKDGIRQMSENPALTVDN